MKRLLFVIAFLLLPAVVHAQVPVYSFQTTSVTSSSTPVNIMPLAQRTTYGCKTLSSAAEAVDAWSYTSASTPGSKAANYTIINIGDAIGDAIPASDANGALQLPWAAVLDSGSTAVTVVCWWR